MVLLVYYVAATTVIPLSSEKWKQEEKNFKAQSQDAS
jgi:hypothetical protein